MDLMYEFLMFQHGNYDTKEKLEYYPNLIMILLGELKTLREAICIPCQHKCASLKATPSPNQSPAPNDLMRPLKRVEDDSPPLRRMPETDVSTPAPCSSYMPVNTTVTSVSSSLVEISTDRRKEFDNQIFYAERDALADTTRNVTFVHSFRHKKIVRCVCFSFDGRYMAVSTGLTNDTSIFIYEVENRKKYCELREYATQYRSYTRPVAFHLCFSTNGRYLAAADVGGRIIIWDIPNKRMRSCRSIFPWNSMPYDVRFSPDGRLVTLSTDAGLVVLNTRDNSRRVVSEGNHFNFSPRGRYIATENKGVLIILDVRTGKEVKRWNRHGAFLKDVKFTPDGRRLLCVYADRAIEQWDVTGADPVLIRKLDVKGYFYHTSISPNFRILASSNELWDLNRLKRQFTLKGHTVVQSVDFSAAGTYLAIGGADGFVSLWKYNWT